MCTVKYIYDKSNLQDSNITASDLIGEKTNRFGLQVCKIVCTAMHGDLAKEKI